MITNRRVQERGAAALIIVVFSVLLLVTVSVGFMRLVVQDQNRTNDDELSRGAYDSAIAGIEDGKRVLQSCLAYGDSVACDAINANECDTVQASKVIGNNMGNDKVVLQSNSGSDGGYEQAYTCVKVDRVTADYQATLVQDVSQVIPLNTTREFTEITVSWFMNRGPASMIDLDTGSTDLPVYSSWSSDITKTRPPIIRAQLIQFNRNNFNLEDFDDNGNGHTIYLYPSTAGASLTNPLDFNATDNRRNADTTGLLRPVACNPSSATYVCSVRLQLPNPISGDASSRQAYLRLTSIYGTNTDVSVAPVDAKLLDVAPAIDSTGRAADVYRRIRARVKLTSAYETQLTPRATVDITRNFCKDLSLSSTTGPLIGCVYSQSN